LLHTLKYVTIHYSIFDFLLGLGIHFEKRSDYHKHTLLQLYEIAYEYLLQQFPDDIILQQLFAVDYYLQHKIKPKILFLEEMPRSKKNQLIETLQLNHHQFRYGVFTIDFDFETFKNIQEIKISKRPLIIQYSGTQTATVVTT
jgi:anaerobic magnesium-protoporphyrin IX monomethyl ester cyclase